MIIYRKIIYLIRLTCYFEFIFNQLICIESLSKYTFIINADIILSKLKFKRVVFELFHFVYVIRIIDP